MSKAKFKLTSVCGCGWMSDQPQAACRNCGQALCAHCGMHCLAVAGWPGESQAVLLKRVQAHMRDLLEQAIWSAEEQEDGRDGARH